MKKTCITTVGLLCPGLVALTLAASTAQAVDFKPFNSVTIIEKHERNRECEKKLRDHRDPDDGDDNSDAIRNQCDLVFTCSGIALNRWLVLTAAHCADHATSLRVTFDFLYDRSRKTFIDVEPTPQIYVGYHPQQSLFQHDIAILKLAQPAPARLNYPRFLPIDFEIPHGSMLERIGSGGRFRPDGAEENRNTWQDAAVEYNADGVLLLKDALSVEGDSGGPIYYRDPKNNQVYLVGLHSTQIIQNGSTYAAGVKIADYASWLENWPYYVRLR
jgi:hypothetical protein